GATRPGSARHRAAAARRRRIVLTTSGIVLAAALGVGGWLAVAGDDESGTPRDGKPSVSATP
ncbi:serine/threonine protein kinase, partial [Streptomyces mesophilus]